MDIAIVHIHPNSLSEGDFSILVQGESQTYNCLLRSGADNEFVFQDMGTIVLGKIESGKLSKTSLLMLMPNRVSWLHFENLEQNIMKTLIECLEHN